MRAQVIQKEKRLESAYSVSLCCVRMTPSAFLQLVAGLVLALFVASCAAPIEYATGRERAATSEDRAATSYAQPPQDRPGLGTKWGEEKKSIARQTRFIRATPDQPLALAKIFYNDRAGIEAMANASELRRVWPPLSASAASLVSIALRDESGRLLPGLMVGERWFVVGHEGRRYSIVVRNRSDFRLEAVLSVDGLDVIDGRPASLGKRGYVLDPHRSLAVEGFRESLGTVAAFRFSPVRESYAQEKYHQTRNVGVIGLAIFNEEGTAPWSDREINRRSRANPFPRSFASPPNE
jgi:hypothetical protein